MTVLKKRLTHLMYDPTLFTYRLYYTLKGIYRVLKPGGEYIMISDGHPESRLAFLKNPNFKWVVSVFELDKTRDNIDNQSKDYIYICSK